MVNLDMSKYSIVTMDEVHSTNAYALENISFFDDKTVIYTSRQTAGRGRFNRKWVCDDSDNIYMSLILKSDNFKSYPFANLTQYLSVCICKMLKSEFNIEAEIKWPNDILVNGAKISGILAETYTADNNIKAIILGLGLNVNMDKNTLEKIDQKATSLFDITKKHYDSEKVLKLLVDIFFENYETFVNKGFEYIKEDYIKRCKFLNKKIKISENGEKKEYFAKSIDNEGLLIAQDEFGNESKIITGDILC